MRQTISVKFFARKDRSNSEGLAPVFMRIGIGEKRLNMITKLYVKPEEWSIESCKVKTNTEEAKRINKALEGFRMKAFDYQRELMNEGSEITIENMKAKWYRVSLEKPRMLMEVFTEHNEQMKALIGQEFSPLTLERYETSFRHAQEFMRWKYKIDDIDIKQLNYEFISNYEFWLKSEKSTFPMNSLDVRSNGIY